ncbi:MAG: hypothetical protein IJ368_03540 [Oscillospiraceae bacterium]|nr:hypothetical protein [Oscillospiraceae bacterium]
MRIVINAPAVRSLSANERTVYKLLGEGLTPKEIARKMRLPLGMNNFADNMHDVPIETVARLITSIREKGWDIPGEKNKEEDKMARGIKLSDGDKKAIIEMYSDGMKAVDIADKLDISVSRVYSVIAANKNEPVTAATDTSSDVENINRVSTDIVTENPENVKTPEANPIELDMSDTYEGDDVYRDIPIPPQRHFFSPAAAEAIYECICRKQDEIFKLDAKMKNLYELIAAFKERIAELNDMQMYAEAELDRLWKDYGEICGGESNVG